MNVNRVQIKGKLYPVYSAFELNGFEPREVQITAYYLEGRYRGVLDIDNNLYYLEGTKAEKGKFRFLVYNYQGKNYNFSINNELEDLNTGMFQIHNKKARGKDTYRIQEELIFVGKSDIKEKSVDYMDYFNSNLSLSIAQNKKFKDYLYLSNILNQSKKNVKDYIEQDFEYNGDFERYKGIENDKPINIMPLIDTCDKKIKDYFAREYQGEKNIDEYIVNDQMINEIYSIVDEIISNHVFDEVGESRSINFMYYLSTILCQSVINSMGRCVTEKLLAQLIEDYPSYKLLVGNSYEELKAGELVVLVGEYYNVALKIFDKYKNLDYDTYKEEILDELLEHFYENTAKSILDIYKSIYTNPKYQGKDMDDALYLLEAYCKQLCNENEENLNVS